MFPARRFSSACPRLFRTAAGPRTGARMFSNTAIRRADNDFVKERRHIQEHAIATTGLWMKISVFIALPFIVLSCANAYRLWEEHWEHWDHMPPLEERVEYSYQNIRTKNFPWGDGDKTLFWNSKVNYHNHDKLK